VARSFSPRYFADASILVANLNGIRVPLTDMGLYTVYELDRYV
jgi:hypothetical protein